ncbi:MAG TPA: hypothetical protein VMR59_01505 [Patescibacteria group bacterium]|nr:hypothetical protein [Patescibacteria group bacterium]
MTRDELIVYMMPFSPDIIEWSLKNLDVIKSFKFSFPPRFVTLQGVLITKSPLKPNDKIIGFFVYDNKDKIYKQDFIVDKNGIGKDFKLYTKLPNKKYTKNVHNINEFFKDYSGGKYYIEQHHLTLDKLPPKLQLRGIQAKIIAEKLEITGLRELNQKELQLMEKQIINEIKKNGKIQ